MHLEELLTAIESAVDRENGRPSNVLQDVCARVTRDGMTWGALVTIDGIVIYRNNGAPTERMSAIAMGAGLASMYHDADLLALVKRYAEGTC